MPESNLPLSKVTLNVAEKIERSGKSSPGMLKYMPTMIKAKDINNNPRNSPKQGEVAKNNDDKNEKKPEKKKTQLNFKAGYMIRNRWEVIKRVGSGGFGEVYRVIIL